MVLRRSWAFVVVILSLACSASVIFNLPATSNHLSLPTPSRRTVFKQSPLLGAGIKTSSRSAISLLSGSTDINRHLVPSHEFRQRFLLGNRTSVSFVKYSTQPGEERIQAGCDQKVYGQHTPPHFASPRNPNALIGGMANISRMQIDNRTALV